VRKFKFEYLVFGALLLFSNCPANGQSSNPTQITVRFPLTNHDIVQMARAKFADSTIIEAIHVNSTNFDVSGAGLVALKNAGVSQAVIDYMLSVSADNNEPKADIVATPQPQPPSTAPAAVSAPNTAAPGQPQPQPIRNLSVLVGIEVVAQRMPLCQPGTFTTVIAYAGKQAKVILLKPANIPHLPEATMDRLPADTRAMLEDGQEAATILVQFEDGTQLDSCGPIAPSRLSDYFELAPGQNLPLVAYEAADAPSTPVSSTVAPESESAARAQRQMNETITGGTYQGSRATPAESLTDEQVNQAIIRGKRKPHTIGLTLVDQQEILVSGLLCDTCQQSGYRIYVYNPEQWIELQAQIAKRRMMPFTLADVTDEMRLPLLHVTALPSEADYLTGPAMALSSSVDRIVLTDTSRQVTIQPLDLENGTVEGNSALRSVDYSTGSANFQMSDVDSLRSADNKGEFFVVVVGTGKNKFFRVKSRDLPVIFPSGYKH
jgi:hypothetical protein